MVTTFDQFVSQEIFDATLQNADLILPLVHPDTPSADQYFRNQISGAMTVSFGYKIPMMIHSAYQEIEEMQPASFITILLHSIRCSKMHWKIPIKKEMKCKCISLTL